MENEVDPGGYIPTFALNWASRSQPHETFSNLKKHIQANHTHEKPHKCHLCDYSSICGSSLRNHIKCKHTEFERFVYQLRHTKFYLFNCNRNR